MASGRFPSHGGRFLIPRQRELPGEDLGKSHMVSATNKERQAPPLTSLQRVMGLEPQGPLNVELDVLLGKEFFAQFFPQFLAALFAHRALDSILY